MKSLKIISLAVICAVAFCFPAYAQAVPKKVAFLDLSRIFDNYDKTKGYDATMEEKHEAYEKERNDKIQKLQEKQNKLSLLKEEEKEKLSKEIETERTAFLEFDQAQRTELTKQRDEKVREILLEIEKVVSDYAKKESIDIVLNDRVLIYGSETLDISDQILAALNQQFNKKE